MPDLRPSLADAIDAMGVLPGAAGPEAEALAGLSSLLHWRLARRLSGAMPGPHRGRQAGSEGVLSDLVPLLRHPDPRRIDLRHSLADPAGMLHVRRFAMPTRVTLHVLVDLSASMGAVGATDRHRLAALLATALTDAAAMGSDASALTVAQGPRFDTPFPPSRRRSRGVLRHMTGLVPQGAGVAGLLDAAATIPQRRTMVMLISDFEMPADQLAELLTAFAGHGLIPFWLRDSGLERLADRQTRLPALLRERDPETGRAHTMVLTPTRAAAMDRRHAQHRDQLAALFAAHGRDPVQIIDRIDPSRLAMDLAERPG